MRRRPRHDPRLRPGRGRVPGALIAPVDEDRLPGDDLDRLPGAPDDLG